jgi:hypothetical protein
MMVWILGYAICCWMGVRAYREFCQPWLAAQRDAIGRIKVAYSIGVDQKKYKDVEDISIFEV